MMAVAPVASCDAHMKFITRELYQGMQGVPDLEHEEFDARWDRACDAYWEALDRIRPSLPPGMRAFAGNTLHDGVVLAVTRLTPSELLLEVDATRNPWGPVGVFRLLFVGVREVEGIEDLVGDDWLYEEVHLHPGAGFDYRVLFWKSDFRVVADEVEVEQLPSDGMGPGRQ